MRMIALLPILYLAHQYSIGDALPVNDPEMAEIWVANGAAIWKEDDSEKLPKAKPVTAVAGVSGESSDGDVNALAGRIPDTQERKTEKHRRKKAQ